MKRAPTAQNQQARISRIRVADAPQLFFIEPAAPKTERQGEDALADKTAKLERVAFEILLAMLLVHLTTYLYVAELPLLTNLLIAARYALWPVIVLYLVYFAVSGQMPRFVTTLAPFMPYFVIGIVSAMAGFSINQGSRLLVFWALAVSAAAMVGLRLKPPVLLKALFVIFAFMIVTSSLFSALFPAYGTVADTRTASGSAWRGLFSGKNYLGEMCGYMMLLLLVVNEIHWGLRVAVFGVAALALVKSESQGAMVIVAGMFGYWLAVPALRRLAMPVWIKPMLLAGTLLLAGAVFFVASGPLLTLLGRDAKLSGRLDIWEAWLTRATQSLWIGAGPGSFTTENSAVTADLSQAFQSYGAIYTPHNMYIAVLGEVGVVGLLALIAPLMFMALVLPFVREGRMPFVCGTVAFTMAVSGMPETREVFGLGLNMCLLVLVYAGTIGQSGPGLLAPRRARPSATLEAIAS